MRVEIHSLWYLSGGFIVRVWAGLTGSQPFKLNP